VQVLTQGAPRLDWKIEFAIVEHLGPETAVNQRADVFDEHAVFVRRNRLGGLLEIDFDFYLSRRTG